MSLALLALLAVLCPRASAASWRQCAGPSAAIDVSDVIVVPDPIQAGAKVTFTLSGEQAPGIEVDSGTLRASVKYMGFKVFTKSGDLCANLAAPTRCPLLPGNASIELIETMPGYLPPGKMVLRLEGVQERQQIFCVEVELASGARRAGAGLAAAALNKLRLGPGNAASSVNIL